MFTKFYYKEDLAMDANSRSTSVECDPPLCVFAVS